MDNLLTGPWPWYIAGPLLGLIVPMLLLLGNKQFGISSSLRDVCAMSLPGKAKYFQYNWRENWWNLVFVLGILLGGIICNLWLYQATQVAISEETVIDLRKLGITDFSGLAPADIFSWEALFTPLGFLGMVVGGFVVGFGVRYAGGCTSGHGIMGLSQLSLASLVALIGFFAGGLIMTHLLFPLIFSTPAP